MGSSRASLTSRPPPQPIPLSLVNLGDFSGSTVKTTTGLAGGLISRRDKSGEQGATPEQEARTVYPFSYVVKSSGAMGGTYVLWAETEPARAEWRDKLREAKTLSDVVADSNKVFELGPLSKDTLAKSTSYAPPPTNSRTGAGAVEPSPFAGQVTCSVPFRTRDRRSLVAIGCEEGVWIGMRNNLASFSKVLHGAAPPLLPPSRYLGAATRLTPICSVPPPPAVKNVTQVACLEAFSIFLVLADHSLFAYQLDALVPSSASAASSGARGPERLSGTAHVLFFSVGQLSGRTLVACVLPLPAGLSAPPPVLCRADAQPRPTFAGTASASRFVCLSPPPCARVLTPVPLIPFSSSTRSSASSSRSRPRRGATTAGAASSARARAGRASACSRYVPPFLCALSLQLACLCCLEAERRLDGARTQRQDFFIPSEAKHVLFLKAKLAIVCTKGFEIMDLQKCVAPSPARPPPPPD